MTPQDDGNGWAEWKRHVLSQLVDNKQDHHDIKEQLVAIHTQIAALKVKSGTWGALGATVPILIGFVVWLITKS